MKKHVSCILFALFAASAQAAQLGINYDPVHSIDFSKGVGLNKKEIMKSAIMKDLDALEKFREKNPRFADMNHLKTFFTEFSSSGNGDVKPVSLNIADVVYDWNQDHKDHPIKLALGVYEFRPTKDACTTQDECKKWTKAQIDAAIYAMEKYPNLIDAVIVGNENIQPKADEVDIMRERMLEDINTVHKVASAKNIPVGTAQMGFVVESMLKSLKELKEGKTPTDPNYKIAEALDFIGANPYPFWEKRAYSESAGRMYDFWTKSINPLKEAAEKPAYITEEGWPSGADDGVHWISDAQPTPENAFGYLNYWIDRDNEKMDLPVTYYFALFDKLPGHLVESHWGIYGPDRHSSLMEGDHSKPLGSDIRVVTFSNKMMNKEKISILACTEALQKDGSQGECYPIEGYLKTGDVEHDNGEVDRNGRGKKNKIFMLDSSGEHYKSLLAIYQTADNKYPRLCYMNLEDIKNLKNNEILNLSWKNGQGLAVCGKK